MKLIQYLALAAVFYLPISYAVGPQPQRPVIELEKLHPLIKRAAYYAFLADSCSVTNDIPSKVRDLVIASEIDTASQAALIEEFKTQKRKFSDGANAISIAKRCYLESGKTKSGISDVKHEMIDFARNVSYRLTAYKTANYLWGEQVRLEREAVANQVRIEREEKESRAIALKIKSMTITERDSDYIMRTAYPLAGIFGKLEYRSTDFLEMRETENGYVVETRLNYINLLDSRHYLKIAFYYDKNGNGNSWKFAGYSDVIAPEQLTAATLLQLLSN